MVRSSILRQVINTDAFLVGHFSCITCIIAPVMNNGVCCYGHEVNPKIKEMDGHKDSFGQYLTSFTESKSYKCLQRPKNFGTSGSLTRHMKTHTEIKPLKCLHCPKTFRIQCYLNTHLRVHTREKPFKCHLCLKSLGQKQTLIKHLQMHEKYKL